MADAVFLVDSDDERELPAPRRGGGNGGAANRVPLHQFLRLIAGGRMMDHGAANTNDDLVETLRRAGVVQSDAVGRAMRACSRDVFVPEEYREEAFIDAPIRVEHLDFNISAPHMHATCLEALGLQPGHKVLDVGSGCGIVTACAAHMVGPRGAVVGVDIRRECVQLSRQNLDMLVANNKEYQEAACACQFELHNVFMPSPKHQGQYDRIHVGASCPADRLQPLVRLLRPEGGVIVVPVAPNDLRVITKRPNGSVTQKVISQVRFSELEVPTDGEVLLCTLKLERRQRIAAMQMPSTYAEDLCDALGLPDCMMSSSPAGVVGGFPSTPGANRPWPQRFARLFSGCGASSGSIYANGEGSCPNTPTGAMALDAPSPMAGTPTCGTGLERLGEPDCVLVGPGWETPAHRVMLQARCEHFRARCDSGMRDAGAATIVVPEHFGQQAMEALLRYVYHDDLNDGADPEIVVSVLHAAQYYGVARLVHICEVTLAKLLRVKGTPPEGMADTAAALLALADDHGLPHLRTVALDFAVQHYEQVSRTESYASLSRDQVNLVAAEACRLYQRTLGAVHNMCKSQSSLPEPTY